VKITVVGCGAIGSYYGGMLARYGQDVHFLLRSDYDVVSRRGLSVHSPNGDFHVQPGCARNPADIGKSDLILIGLKTTANDQFRRLLPPLVSEHTTILTLQNGLGNEQRLAEIFPAGQIMGGLCFVCLNRAQPGVVQHLDHGLVVLGEFQCPPNARTRQVEQLFSTAGIPCRVTEHLAQAHWEKLVWNIPFNGLGVAGIAGFEAVRSGQLDKKTPEHGCLTTADLLADRQWEGLVRELMNEVISGARALGFPVDPLLAEKQIGRTRSMGGYKASTLIDFERGLPLELESLFLEPLRQARVAGAKVPRLEALCRILAALDRR
jgi:2-dehydropantoate 2-reductase